MLEIHSRNTLVDTCMGHTILVCMITILVQVIVSEMKISKPLYVWNGG